ncbi:MAG TPA: trypsin-like peptidase domain-containing protein [Gaiellales bacterium]|jgi:putative serine protease PepD|nr:trypsin-like peptidase domain-containing protein [Gaiellales bacterium]
MRTPIAVAALLATAGLGASVAAVAVHEADGGGGTTIIRRPAVTVNAAPAASTSPSGGMSVSEIYRKSVPGVVEVLATGQSSGGNGFFGGQTESAQGTGFQVDSKGDIVTNYHVVENSDSVRVRLNDGHSFPGRVIGRDPAKDLAVIRISAPSDELHPLTFADSSAVQVGDSVVAIGDPYGLRNTATAGIVSALRRTIVSPSNEKITGVIQTDAAINSGNSGGPLLNSQGQVIGVNSQIESGSQNGGGGGNIGIGFSIPSNTVASVAHSLIETAKSKPYVGIVLVTVTPSVANATGMSAGVEIVSVTKGAPGDMAGLQGATGTKTIEGTQFETGGDVITKIDGTPVHTSEELIAQISTKKPGQDIQLQIVRGGHTSTVTVTLGSN